MPPSQEELQELWLTVQRYIVTKNIHCAEVAVEDRVYESAPVIIEELCDIVGYAKSDDEDDDDE